MRPGGALGVIAAALARFRFSHSASAEAPSPSCALDDPAVASAKRGEAAGIAALYDRHHEPLRRFARHLLCDSSAAEDLVQEVFLALPRALASYRGEAGIRGFLFSIAANQARHHVRSLARRRRAHERLSEAATHDPPTTDTDPVRRRLAMRAVRAMDELPIEQRTALVLCDLEDHTSTEAAAILGVPEGTVRTRLFHARRKLREALGAEVER